jgi:alkanesulfonate monooxygenase SsuD/methylene tetrahydromethanopterin reductase-like flavin-dependent oxidoreductase (luciferase family)
MADEYMDVLYKLWEGSWKDDAVVKDLEKGQYADPERIRPINHHGKYFNVPGIHICEPSRQRTPFLFQAGTSKAGREFGAKHAEAIFVEGQTPEKVMPSIDIIKKLAKEKYACDPESIKFIAAINIIAAETDEAAEVKRDDWHRMVTGKVHWRCLEDGQGIDLSTYSNDEDFRFVKMPAVQSMIDHWTETVPGTKDLKWTKSRVSEYLNLGDIAGKIVGGPKTVADELERWADVASIDGFNL